MIIHFFTASFPKLMQSSICQSPQMSKVLDGSYQAVRYLRTTATVNKKKELIFLVCNPRQSIRWHQGTGIKPAVVKTSWTWQATSFAMRCKGEGPGRIVVTGRETTRLCKRGAHNYRNKLCTDQKGIVGHCLWGRASPILTLKASLLQSCFQDRFIANHADFAEDRRANF